MKVASDEATITAISSVQRAPRKREVKHFGVNVNRIINILRNNDGKISKAQIQAEMPDFDFNSKENLNELNKYNKIKYDFLREVFLLKSEYNLKNIEDLKNKIKTTEHGLLEDEILTDSYPGIKVDIEKLKNEKFVKIIYNNEKKCNVLFYRDMADEFEKIIINPEYEEAIKELRKIWTEELNNVRPISNVVIKKRQRPDDYMNQNNNFEMGKPGKRRKLK